MFKQQFLQFFLLLVQFVIIQQHLSNLQLILVYRMQLKFQHIYSLHKKHLPFLHLIHLHLQNHYFLSKNKILVINLQVLQINKYILHLIQLYINSKLIISLISIFFLLQLHYSLKQFFQFKLFLQIIYFIFLKLLLIHLLVLRNNHLFLKFFHILKDSQINVIQVILLLTLIKVLLWVLSNYLLKFKLQQKL